MLLRDLHLRSFRNYRSLQLSPAPGLTVVRGENGQGKTNLIEAIWFLARLESFRGVPSDVLVTDGEPSAAIKGTFDVDGRRVDVDVELDRGRPTRARLNDQRVLRTRDLIGQFHATVFAPDDLVLVKGGPGDRRNYLDDLLVSLRPSADRVRRDLERVLRQRSTLLKQCGGRLDGDATATLDVWDAKLTDLGTQIVEARLDLVDRLQPHVRSAYERLARRGEPVALTYECSWLDSGLAVALERARREDVRRGLNSVGPHRDDVRVELRGSSTRTHASQGEQRTLALALRLAGHELVHERTGTAPILLLDDVLSELDESRSAALMTHLPPGQALLTTVEPIGPSVHPDLIIDITKGTIDE